MSITLHELMKNQNVGVELVSHRPNAPGEHTDRDSIDALPPAHEQPSYGKVFLVGAGPGDPELITLKGLRSLRKADVVVYDRLICLDLLDEAPSQARRVFAGKASGRHSMKQQEINALLITYARRGCIVVRLKGGDPFVFGRGGEEALALAQAGIPFEVVPGVSSAIAVPAYAGIPVTQRDLVSSVTIVTGHDQQSSGSSGVNWEALATLGGTLVILMGVEMLSHITQRLLSGGLNPDTPAAVIQQGTVPQQRVVKDTIVGIAERAWAARITSPAVVVIGAVVALSDPLAWFETLTPQLMRC
jgi:uroporphyrin-III C-methyltransferase